MGRTAKLGIRKKKNGKWYITGYWIPDPDCPDERRRYRPVFDTKAEAEDEVAKIKKKEFEEGAAAHRLGDDERMDAVRAKAILKPYKASLEDAAKHYAKHIEATKRSITFNELRVEFLATKKKEMDVGADGAIKRVDYRDIKARFNKFAELFGERLVEEISTADIHNWLEDLKLVYSNRNRSNFRKVLSRIFSYATNKSYTTKNPVAEVKVIKVKRVRPAIFSAEQMRLLLEKAPISLRPYIFIGAFAGLRPSETERLLWSDIRADGQIHVNKHGKTGSRYVSIQPNLAKWLRLYEKADGNVSVPNADRKTSALVKELKIFEIWPQDVLRHSFGTAHYCCFEAPGQTAHQMGNEIQTVKRYYLDAVPKTDAAEWWKIDPADETEK